MASLKPLSSSPSENAQSPNKVTLRPLNEDPKQSNTPWHSFATGAGRTEFPNLPEFSTRAISQEKGSFSPETLKTFAGYISTADEKELSNIIKKAVPGASVKSDKFGNAIINYRKKDYYVNKPGFSEVDALQFTADIAAFAPLAKVASALKGVARFAGLSAGAAVTQGAKEGATAALGGDQGLLDVGVRVGTAAASAGVVDALTRVVGNAIKKGWKLATKNGAVTTTAKKILENEGIKDAPDEMIIAMQNYLDQVPGSILKKIRAGGAEAQDAINKEASNIANAALARGRSAITGIPKTAGQESGDVAALRAEQRMREGGFGPTPKQTMSEFDDAQKRAIDDAVLRAQQQAGGGGSIVGDEQAAGGKVVDMLGSARSKMEQKIDDAYNRANERYSGPAQPTIAGSQMADLPRRVLSAFRDKSFIITGETPATKSAIELVEQYSKGQALQQGASMRMGGLEKLRQGINQLYGQARNSSDKKGIIEIKKQLDDFVNDHIDIPEMQAARSARTKMGEAFEPRKGVGTKVADRARTIVSDLSLGDVQSNQKAINAVLGNSGLNSGNLPVIKHLSERFPEVTPIIKEAAVLRAVYGSSTQRAKEIGPQRMLSNLRDALDGSGKEVSDELFSKAEKVILRSLRDDLEAIVPRKGDANPSGTAAALSDIVRKYSSRLPLLPAVFGAAGEPVAAAVALTRGVSPQILDAANKVTKGFTPPKRINPLYGGLLGQSVGASSEAFDPYLPKSN